jgi:hypothetical protein
MAHAVATQVPRIVHAARFAATLALLFAAVFAAAGCSKRDSPTSPAAGGAARPNVSGIVRLANHSPATDVMVSLEPDLSSAMPIGASFYNDATFTDSSGAFYFSGVPAGQFRLLAGIPRDTPNPSFTLSDSLVATAAVHVAAPGVFTTPLSMVLGVPGVFKGRVLDAVSGRPVEALVTTDGAIVLGSSDTLGDYALPGVATGTWRVIAAEFVDSTTTLIGSVSVVMPGAGDTISVADIRISLVPAAAGAATRSPDRPSAASPGFGERRERLERIAAVRERRDGVLERLRRAR